MVDMNERISAQNEHLFEVLANVTDQSRPQSAIEWWDWWIEENEYYRPPEKPTEMATTFRPMISCFVRGTPVWTSTGPVAIEKIRPGEVVLAQDPQTGELAFKPVLATTYRPASPTLEVRAGGSVVRGTRGHPFWVSGEGCRWPSSFARTAATCGSGAHFD